MDKNYLYHQIAESIRQEILHETLCPGDRLPSVRQMAARWDCTIGTIQRAYEELARQGLVVSRPGQGTHVAAAISAAAETPLRRASLVHRAEGFLLEALTAGYTATEVDLALRLAGPNPGPGSIVLAYELPHAGRARLELLDARGRHVRTIADGTLPAGPGTAAWDGSDDAGRRVAPGVYFALLRFEGARRVARIVVDR